MNRLCFIDVETTGLNANKHAIVQLAYIIEVNGEVVESGSFSINPNTYNKPRIIDNYALEVNGLKLETLATYDNAIEVFKKFKLVLNKYIIVGEKLTFVGYNSPFDIMFVQALFIDMGSNDYGRYFTYKDLDVFALVKYMLYLGFFPELLNHKLTTMCKACGIADFDAHDAIADINATRSLHYILLDMLKGK